jgi:hypothetical protein
VYVLFSLLDFTNKIAVEIKSQILKDIFNVLLVKRK